MVASQLLEAAVAEAIQPGIADMADVSDTAPSRADFSAIRLQTAC